MTIRMSEGAAKALMGSAGPLDASFREMFQAGALYGYAGVQPDSANDAVTGYTLLAIASKNGDTFVPGDTVTGNGIEFDDAVYDSDLNAVLLGVVAGFNLMFKGVTGANGNMGWCRLVANPVDNGASSTTLYRLDMSVGVTTGDVLIQPSTKIVENGLYPATMTRFGYSLEVS